MNLSMFKKTSLFAVAVASIVGCAAAPEGAPSEGTDTSTTSAADTKVDETARREVDVTGTAHEKDELQKIAAAKLLDPTYTGMVAMGIHEDWSFFFDKDTQLVVATHGEQSIAFNPTELDDDKIASLAADGVPSLVIMSWKGWACRAACWTIAGMGCGAVGALCTAGTVVTVGGIGVPCWVATVAACGAAGGGASVCSDWCTKKYH
jgi:hypothetical protein